MVSYLTFIKNQELQTGLQALVNSNSLFLRDLLVTRNSPKKPLFIKYLFRNELSGVYQYNRTRNINLREEDQLEYTIRQTIDGWITQHLSMKNMFVSIPAHYHHTTVPSKYDPKFESVIFPTDEFYSMVTFGEKDIIAKCKGKVKGKESGEDIQIINDYLDELKKEGKISKGRLNLNRFNTMEQDELVFFYTQNFIAIPCISREYYKYIREMVFEDVGA